MADAHDPRTVYLADSEKLADAAIEFLAANNIPAELGRVAPVEVSALTGESNAPAEFPILITDPTKVEDAKALLTKLEQYPAFRAIVDKRAARTGNVTATCEDCGKPSEWPAAVMGTTEVCPHCGGYMDIPDPDEDWSDADFGTPEEDEEEAKE